MRQLMYAGIFVLMFIMPTAAEPIVLRLWPTDPPATGLYDPTDKIEYYDASKTAFNVSNIKTPSMAVYLPSGKPTTARAAVVICPGGGYAVEAAAHEGSHVAQRLADNGIVGIVVKYRLPGGVTPTALPLPQRDAMRAMQLVRQHAAEWSIDPKRVGVLGFSAGGHLAATVTTLSGEASTFAGDAENDEASKLSARPDFSVLVYPVISLTDISHGGSKLNLLGPAPTPELIAHYSNEAHVTSETPPMFIVHASDDTVVPVENALVMATAAAKAKVPCELHLLATGGHGFGMGSANTPASKWFDQMLGWMRDLGVTSAESPR